MITSESDNRYSRVRLMRIFYVNIGEFNMLVRRGDKNQLEGL